MRLAKFSLANVEPILAEWEAFAAALAPGATMTKLALRDDAEKILLATARSMQVHQSLAQQASKSKGRRGADAGESDRLDDASTRHARERVGSGFDIVEVVSEYRALRASVLRLWRESLPQPDLDDLDDVTRFNEAIDQSLAEAVGSYTERVDRSRQLFLAILGHDLRNPLNCIRMGARLLSPSDGDATSVEALAMISTEAEAMGRLIHDMIDFASTWLGGSMPLKRAPLNLQPLCRQVVDGFRATHPRRTLHFRPRGDLAGHGDADRLRQIVSNLLGNAFQHGAPDGPIELSVAAEGSTVVLSVHNEGAPIPPEALPTLFDPLVRHADLESALQRAPGSIGLGLYIVREIVHASGGEIEVASTAEQGTTFTVRLPRLPAVAGRELSDPKAAG
ncbi:sensor histidine kinase [Alienimonas californiensis]|uniref:histidine kinase n=1 Tax=Alienimonas californiensis TaxID=2527989 RepID=A0A517PB78_9PLAN|nr:HAMP domain-containing sensor histidine kinase [Alienimonas californiensis]QDT16619.1 Bacteriophytochrome [Alienimonas californiensis]